MEHFLKYLFLALLPVTVLCGPWAIYLAARRTFWKASGAILLGILLTALALYLSVASERMHYAAVRASGHHVINDMPGFGQVLLGGLSLIYFSCILLVGATISIVRKLNSPKKR
jgi:hypothetical protein